MLSRNRTSKDSGVTRASALAALAAVALPVHVRAQVPPLRIGAATTDTYGEPWFAQDIGAFERRNLAVEITAFSNGSQIVEAISANAIDVGLADVLQTAWAVLRGLPLTFFAGGSAYNTDAPTTVLCVAANSAVQSGRDLEGQTVGCFSLGAIAQLAPEDWIHATGGDSTKVKFVEISATAMVAAIQRGTVAAGMVGEPFISANRDNIKIIAKPYDYIAKHFYIAAWCARSTWLKQNADTVRRFTSAVYETARWLNTHHSESAPTLARITKMDSDRIKTMTRATYSTALDVKLMQPVLDIAFRYKAIDRNVSASELVASLS